MMIMIETPEIPIRAQISAITHTRACMPAPVEISSRTTARKDETFQMVSARRISVGGRSRGIRSLRRGQEKIICRKRYPNFLGNLDKTRKMARRYNTARSAPFALIHPSINPRDMPSSQSGNMFGTSEFSYNRRCWFKMFFAHTEYLRKSQYWSRKICDIRDIKFLRLSQQCQS